MTILKIIETLQIYSEDFIAYKLDGQFANAVTEAVALLIGQGERITELEEQNLWVPVTERLPERGNLVLCIGKKGGMFLASGMTLFSDGSCWCSVPNARSGRNATHWMPLPEPPKEDT